MTIWAASGWRSLKDAAEVRYQSVHSVCADFGKVPSQQHILDINNEEPDQQQAIVSIALAQQLVATYNVVVVSNEVLTLEDRCTVPEACAFLGISHYTVHGFLDAVATTLVTKDP